MMIEASYPIKRKQDPQFAFRLAALLNDDSPEVREWLDKVQAILIDHYPSVYERAPCE